MECVGTYELGQDHLLLPVDALDLAAERLQLFVDVL